jgi:hypothetical protein
MEHWVLQTIDRHHVIHAPYQEIDIMITVKIYAYDKNDELRSNFVGVYGAEGNVSVEALLRYIDPKHRIRRTKITEMWEITMCYRSVLHRKLHWFSDTLRKDCTLIINIEYYPQQ